MFVCLCMSLLHFVYKFLFILGTFLDCEGIFGWSSQFKRAFQGLRLGFRAKVRIRCGLGLGVM